MAAAPSPWADAFFEEVDKEEYDAFFTKEGGRANGVSSAAAPPKDDRGGAPALAAAPVPAATLGPPQVSASGGAGSGDIESEYALLSPGRTDSGTVNTAAATAGGGPGTVMTFSLDDDDDLDMDCVQSEYAQDCRPPELPDAPSDFVAADLRLREVLADFYLRHRAENLSNINLITKRYRGRAVTHLWAQMSNKYRVPPHVIVELVSDTLYIGSPFEYSDERQAEVTEDCIVELQASAAGSLDGAEDRADLLRRCLESPVHANLSNELRFLCFRGLQGCSELRPKVWKLLLGCLPMDRPSDWASVEGEMRTLYAKYKAEVLIVSPEQKFEVRMEGSRVMEAMHLLQQIQKDVDRTRHDVEHFRRPATRAALVSLLFVYAQMNPDVQYVQGMNEVAAVAMHVASAEPESEEADAFWCFTYLMAEVKPGFLQALASQADKPSDSVASLDRLLQKYDPELARHLQKTGCPISVFSFRWCTLLFAQDMPLQDVVCLWDCFIADPLRFGFVGHVCLAALMLRREELLATKEQGALAALVRRLPHTVTGDLDGLLRRSWAICALERRAQTPPFPAKSAAQVVQDFSGWAATAMQKAQELGSGVTQKVQQRVPPGLKDKVGMASGTAALAAQGGLQAVKAWFEQDVPIQPETAAKAQQTAQSLWQTVRTSSTAALSQTHRLATEYGQAEKLEQTSAKLHVAADAAASASSAVLSRLALALAKPGVGDAAGGAQAAS